MQKSALQTHLEKANHVSVTLDIWTDRRMPAFMAVSAHTFISCKAKAFLLSFESFKGSRTGARIAEEYEKVLLAHKLVGKIDFCISDSAANMRKAFDIIACMRDDEVGEASDVTAQQLDDDSLFEHMTAEDADDVQLAVDRRCDSR